MRGMLIFWGVVLCLPGFVKAGLTNDENKVQPIPGFPRSLVIASLDALTAWPLQILKSKIQNQRPLTLSPRDYYQGFSIGGVTTLMTTLSIMYIDEKITDIVSKNNTVELSERQKFLSGLVAGAMSSFVVAPGETFMHQTAAGKSKRKLYHHIVRDPRRLYRGQLPLLFRDGTYALGPTYFTRTLREKLPGNEQQNPVLRTIFAGMLSGVTVAVINQPFDTVAARMKGSPLWMKKKSINFTAVNLYRDGGIGAFWRGGLVRSGLISLSTVVIGVCDYLLRQCEVPDPYYVMTEHEIEDRFFGRNW